MLILWFYRIRARNWGLWEQVKGTIGSDWFWLSHRVSYWFIDCFNLHNFQLSPRLLIDYAVVCRIPGPFDDRIDNRDQKNQEQGHPWSASAFYHGYAGWHQTLGR